MDRCVMTDASWPPANAGKETIHSIMVGGEVFVRHDHDAYAMGYSACKDDARRLATDMLEDWFKRGYDMPGEDMKGGELIAAIDALPPKDDGDWDIHDFVQDGPSDE
jgi:hypothetical protein